MGGKRRSLGRCNPSSSTLAALSLSLSIRANGKIDILIVAHSLPPWISLCLIGQVDGDPATSAPLLGVYTQQSLSIGPCSLAPIRPSFDPHTGNDQHDEITVALPVSLGHLWPKTDNNTNTPIADT
jgi:hypothetical protein